jgi:hypothetical protein
MPISTIRAMTERTQQPGSFANRQASPTSPGRRERPLPSEADLIRVIQSVSAGLFGTPSQPTGPVPAEPGDVIIGTVTYAGDWQALLRIECNVFDAMQLVHRLIGPCEDLQSHAMDFIGEFTNMVAGNLRPLLPRGADTGAPHIVVSQPRPNVDCDYQILRQRFALENISLTVSFLAERVVP